MTVYSYDELERVAVETETIFEPLDQEAAPEFAGVVATLSLPHGSIPPEPVAEWSVYKVYEKVVIWLRRVAPQIKEGEAK